MILLQILMKLLETSNSDNLIITDNNININIDNVLTIKLKVSFWCPSKFLIILFSYKGLNCFILVFVYIF